MVARLKRIFRKPLWHTPTELTVSEWAAPVRTIGHTCRGCGKPARAELTTDESDRVEYLCYDDLGPFLELFADPRVQEWTVVRLP